MKFLSIKDIITRLKSSLSSTLNIGIVVPQTSFITGISATIGIDPHKTLSIGHKPNPSNADGDKVHFASRSFFVKSVRDKTSRNKPSGESHVRSFIESADGSRRFHVDEKCNGIAEDLESLRYPENSGDLKPESLKDGYHDHGGDMVRYFFVNKFPIKDREVKLKRR